MIEELTPQIINLIKTFTTLAQLYTFYLVATWGYQLWSFLTGA